MIGYIIVIGAYVLIVIFVMGIGADVGILIVTIGVIGFAAPNSYTMVPEIAPPLAVSVANVAYWSLCTVVVFCFPLMVTHVGLRYGFMVFLFASFFGLIFIFFFVKETKDLDNQSLLKLYTDEKYFHDADANLSKSKESAKGNDEVSGLIQED